MLALSQSGGKAGPIGLFVVLALVAATYFLFRSMSNQLKKVPPSFDTQSKKDEDAAAETPTDDAAGDPA